MQVHASLSSVYISCTILIALNYVYYVYGGLGSWTVPARTLAAIHALSLRWRWLRNTF